jgi:hypothetical protein
LVAFLAQEKHSFCAANLFTAIQAIGQSAVIRGNRQDLNFNRENTVELKAKRENQTNGSLSLKRIQILLIYSFLL